MTHVVIEGVHCGNYQQPGWEYSDMVTPCSGVVIKDPDNWGIDRHTFHPYSGRAPIHCAPPAGYRTYHRKGGY
jgi:hypothetical protein